MINYFKKRVKFRKSIKGIFKDWEVDEYTATKDNYEIWIGNGRAYFEDFGEKDVFLGAFNEWEKNLLWEEFKKREFYFRQDLNNKFNLSN